MVIPLDRVWILAVVGAIALYIMHKTLKTEEKEKEKENEEEYPDCYGQYDVESELCRECAFQNECEDWSTLLERSSIQEVK